MSEQTDDNQDQDGDTGGRILHAVTFDSGVTVTYTYDPQAQMAYLRFKDGTVLKTIETGDWVRFDLGGEHAEGRKELLGIEVDFGWHGSQVDVRELPWRLGRHRGRNVYAVVSGMPDVSSDDDIDVARFDDPELAAHVVALHNQALKDAE